MNNFMNAAYNEALKAYKKNEVPVGAVIVMNNKIISKAYNTRVKSHDVTNHAEVIAIRKASKKIKDWRLNTCDLYVTLKPCDMCLEIIRESRINNVYYLIDRLDFKKKYNKTNISLCSDVDIQNYKILLNNFFKEKTNR